MGRGLADSQNLTSINLGKDAKLQKMKIYIKARNLGSLNIIKETRL